MLVNTRLNNCRDPACRAARVREIIRVAVHERIGQKNVCGSNLAAQNMAAPGKLFKCEKAGLGEGFAGQFGLPVTDMVFAV